MYATFEGTQIPIALGPPQTTVRTRELADEGDQRPPWGLPLQLPLTMACQVTHAMISLLHTHCIHTRLLPFIHIPVQTPAGACPQTQAAATYGDQAQPAGQLPRSPASPWLASPDPIASMAALHHQRHKHAQRLARPALPPARCRTRGTAALPLAAAVDGAHRSSRREVGVTSQLMSRNAHC